MKSTTLLLFLAIYASVLADDQKFIKRCNHAKDDTSKEIPDCVAQLQLNLKSENTNLKQDISKTSLKEDSEISHHLNKRNSQYIPEESAVNFDNQEYYSNYPTNFHKINIQDYRNSENFQNNEKISENFNEHAGNFLSAPDTVLTSPTNVNQQYLTAPQSFLNSDLKQATLQQHDSNTIPLDSSKQPLETKGGYLVDIPIERYCLKPRGQFPAKYCDYFVNCWDDIIIEQECPAGLVFSFQGFCDYPYNVDCSGRPLSRSIIQQQPTQPSLNNNRCTTQFGTFRNNNNCSEFYICNHGEAIKFSCPPGLFFNNEFGVCDYSYNVDCINPRPLIPETNAEIPVQLPLPSLIPSPLPPSYNYLYQIPPDTIFGSINCFPENVYKMDLNCKTVVICVNGKLQVISCNNNNAFNIDLFNCVPKHLKKC